MSSHFHCDSGLGAETGLQPVVYVISFMTSFFCVTYWIILCMLGCHSAPLCLHCHLPRCLTSFPCLAFIYQITLPETLFPASASLNSTGFCMSQMCAVPSHYSPPPHPHPTPPAPYRRCQRSNTTQTSWQCYCRVSKTLWMQNLCFVALQAPKSSWEVRIVLEPFSLVVDNR